MRAAKLRVKVSPHLRLKRWSQGKTTLLRSPCQNWTLPVKVTNRVINWQRHLKGQFASAQDHSKDARAQSTIDRLFAQQEERGKPLSMLVHSGQAGHPSLLIKICVCASELPIGHWAALLMPFGLWHIWGHTASQVNCEVDNSLATERLPTQRGASLSLHLHSKCTTRETGQVSCSANGTCHTAALITSTSHRPQRVAPRWQRLLLLL